MSLMGCFSLSLLSVDNSQFSNKPARRVNEQGIKYPLVADRIGRSAHDKFECTQYCSADKRRKQVDIGNTSG